MSAQAQTAAPLNEETLWRGSPSLVVLIGHVVLMLIVLIAVPLITAAITQHTNDLDAASRINHIGWLVTLIILIIQFINFLVALLKRRSIVYTITNQRVMIEQGVLSKSLNEIDLRYIDDTQFFQSFPGRLLGIGNVTLISSDKAFPTTVLQAIARPRDIREMIRARAYQISQRQLFTRAT